MIDKRVTSVTVSKVEPEMLPEVATIVVDPAVTPVANPLEPEALLMVATDVSEELQVADVVISCVELSEKCPVAEYCTVVLFLTDLFAGVTVIETRLAAVTVSLVEPEMLPEVAAIVVNPAAILVANPLDPWVSLMVAIDVSDELHSTEVVMS